MKPPEKPKLTLDDVLCTVETRDRAHIAEINRLLKEEGVRLSMVNARP
ncbi:MAG: hypothetical protein HY735_05800 [Verrucomicrobia bacterium]|nr:hypothetical protein [Verrucomicrobiota bacterium]